MTALARAGLATPHLRWVLRLAYIVVVGFATLPDVDLLAGEVGRSLDSALRPITPRDFIDGIRNVVLFAGWGAVWVATAPPGPALPMMRNALLTGTLLSATVEGLQFFSDARHPSLLDVIANSLGAIAGAAGLGLAIVFVRAGRGARSYVGIPMLLFAAPYALVTLLESFGSLFRQERLPRVGGGPGERFRAALDLMEAPTLHAIPWFDLVLFAPAGFLAVAALAEFGMRHAAAAWAAGIAGTGVMILTELARGFVGSPIGYGPLLVHAFAVGAGAAAGAVLVPRLSARVRGARRALGLLAGYGVLVALWTLRPFRPEFEIGRVVGKLSLERFLPLRAYLDRVDLFTAVDVLLSFLLFVPIGCLLAVWPLRLHGPLRTMLPGFYAAAALEGAQLFVAGRWFDVTDIIVHGAGVALGWVVVRRAGFRPYGEALPPGPRPARGTNTRARAAARP